MAYLGKSGAVPIQAISARGIALRSPSTRGSGWRHSEMRWPKVVLERGLRCSSACYGAVMLAEPCHSPGGSPVLERLDPLFQVAALPILAELLDNARHVRCLLGCELTTSQSRNDLALNRREIVQALHIPDLQRDRPSLPCRSNPVKAQPKRYRIARKR